MQRYLLFEKVKDNSLDEDPASGLWVTFAWLELPLQSTCVLGILTVFWRVPKSMYFVFLWFKDKRLHLNHSETTVSCILSLVITSSLVFVDTDRAGSSAYRLVLQLIRWSGKSFMYIVNKRGPKIEPWGTPTSTRRDDERLLFTLVIWCLLLRHDSIHFWLEFLIP